MMFSNSTSKKCPERVMTYRQLANRRQSGSAAGRGLLGFAPLFTLLLCAEPASAQSPPVQSPSSAPEQFQARIKEFEGVLQSTPQQETSLQFQRASEVDFVIGNMLFVLLHETGHNLMTELKLPILARQEDAADVFAVLTLLKVGSPMSHRVLVEAARGWFFSDRRAKKEGDAVVYYDDHGLDEQRAYHIVCLMIGSDPAKFADLATEVKLPQERQTSCQRDYADASSGWDAVLKPHRREADQPKTEIEVTYGDGKGNLDQYAQGFRSLQLLETVREHIAEELRFPRPFTLEMQSCGNINAVWDDSTHRLTLCYELAADFDELYRLYGTKLRRALDTVPIEDQPGYVPEPDAERLPANYQRQMVFYRTTAAPGTIIVHPAEHSLYVVQGKNRALRYSIGVGRKGFQVSGLLTITRKDQWPEWDPSPELIARQPNLPRPVAGGPGNPLGARGLYLGNTICIHGTNQPQTIGHWVPSGCFRLINGDVIDLSDRVPVGTKVMVRQAPEL